MAKRFGRKLIIGVVLILLVGLVLGACRHRNRPPRRLVQAETHLSMAA